MEVCINYDCLQLSETMKKTVSRLLFDKINLDVNTVSQGLIILLPKSGIKHIPQMLRHEMTITNKCE